MNLLVKNGWHSLCTSDVVIVETKFKREKMK